MYQFNTYFKDHWRQNTDSTIHSLPTTLLVNKHAKLSLLGHSCMQSILVGLNNRRSEHLFFGGFLLLAAKRIRLWRKAKNDTGQEIGPPSAHGII